MSKIKFGDVEETVVTRDEFPMSKARQVLGSQTIAVLGYGVQGPAQALNLRDNEFNAIVGQREGTSSWDKAVEDGWVPGETLFSIEEAAKRGEMILNLLSDAGQIAAWPTIKPALTNGKMLVFSHGFGVVFNESTEIVPPTEIDVALVAPKGSGRSVRRLFQQNKGINSSFAIHQDYTGKARDRICALGIAIGSGYLFETTFRNEVVSDLVGERGVLMGALAGIIEAQYRLLRKHGHSPSEAFNETVEELTQSLVPLVAENGMDWMYESCSTTAQRGALDWRHKFREAVTPVFEDLYQSVASGEEAKVVIKANSASNYKEKLGAELKDLRESELWKTGVVVRNLRPE